MKNFLREIIFSLLKPFMCIFLFFYYLRSFSLKVLQIIFILCLVCGCHNAIIKHQYLFLIIASCIGIFILSLCLFERFVHKHEYLMKKRNGVFIDNCDKRYENERTDEDTNVSSEGKSGVCIILVSVGVNKIAVLKEVREITGLGIKEAKNLIDAAPKIIKKDIEIKEAEEIKQKLEDAGATVKIK